VTNFSQIDGIDKVNTVGFGVFSPRDAVDTDPLDLGENNPLQRITSGPNHSVPATPDDKYALVAKRIIERYDRSEDNTLDASELEKMLAIPAEEDVNHDGKITVDEYAVWMKAREKR
jgi:hypothetical protein